MRIKILPTSPLAMLPTYATKGAACFDLYSTCEADFGLLEQSAVIPTGLKFEIPEGYAMFIFSRSGHGFKNDMRLANCVGIIDSDYRGEVMVKLTKDRMGPQTVKVGERIAQACILPVGQVTFGMVSELMATDRGEGGFGSTGK